MYGLLKETKHTFLIINMVTSFVTYVQQTGYNDSTLFLTSLILDYVQTLIMLCDKPPLETDWKPADVRRRWP
jgi:hypothetical protein